MRVSTKLMSDAKPQIQEAQGTANRINANNNINNNDKDNNNTQAYHIDDADINIFIYIYKEARGKIAFPIEEKMQELHLPYPQKPSKQKESRMKCLKH